MDNLPPFLPKPKPPPATGPESIMAANDEASALRSVRAAGGRAGAWRASASSHQLRGPSPSFADSLMLKAVRRCFMATPQTRPSIIEWSVTAWRDAFAAVSQMPVVLGVAILVVLVLNAIGAMVLPRKVGEPTGTWFEILGFVIGLVQGFLLTPVAIAVHRFVLLGERAASYRLEPADPRFQRFFFFTVIVQVMVGVPGALLSLVDKTSGAGAAAVGLVGVVLFVIAAIVMLRTLILFPAIAVDAPGADWRNALQDSKGHSWRILFIVIAVALPLMLIYLPVFFWLWWPAGPSGGALAFLVVLEAVEIVLAAAAYAALASRLFAQLADRLAAGSGGVPAPPAAGFS
jgi:hypothetical protein